MKICVVGSGGIGGYFGARLIDAGFDVTLIARGAHGAALKSQGLTLHSIEDDLHLPRVNVLESPVDNAPYDLVLVCVKAWQVPDVAIAIDGTLSDSGVVVPLQNGVDAAAQLSARLGESAVLSGLCGLVSLVKEPGVIEHVGVSPFVKIGECAGAPGARVKTLVEKLNNTEGMSVTAPDDMQVALWQKFLFIVAMSGIGSVTRAPIGITRENDQAREMLEQCITETCMVARAMNVLLPQDAVTATMRQIDQAPFEATASMQRDIMQGNPSELYAQNGAVVRMGKETGVATPINSFITTTLALAERKARGALVY